MRLMRSLVLMGAMLCTILPGRVSNQTIAHEGWHAFYQCPAGYLFRQDRWAQYFYYPAYNAYYHYWSGPNSSWHWIGYC